MRVPSSVFVRAWVCFVHVLRPVCLLWILLSGFWCNVLVMFTYDVLSQSSG